MNILHVSPRYYPCAGGAELYLHEIGKRLALAGHAISVYTTDAWDVEHFWSQGKRTVAEREEVHDGVRIRRFPVRQLPGSPKSYLALRYAMAEISDLPFDLTGLTFWASRWTPWVPDLERALAASGEPFDLVHATNFPYDSLIYAAWRFAQARRIPFIVTPLVHLGEPGDRSIVRYYTLRNQMALLRAADAVIALTELEKEQVARRGVPPNRLHRVGAGINPDELSGGDAARFRARYRIDSPMVFALATLTRDKGIFHLVRAMDRLWAGGGDSRTAATLVLAGPTTTEFTKFFAAQAAGDRVKRNTRVLGFVSDEDKRDLLAAGDVFALPSRTDSFGIGYLEAWFYGKPVIGARAGGVPEVIHDGSDGLLVDFGDVEALAARIAQLLDDHELAARLGAAGRARTLAEYTWDCQYALVRDVYERLAGRRL